MQLELSSLHEKLKTSKLYRFEVQDEIKAKEKEIRNKKQSL